MRYSDNVDYLISSIIYLGTHGYYWARTPGNMAAELSLDERRLQEVFEGFPGIYRKSVRASKNGQHYYALQARCAQKEGDDTSDPEEVSYITPLETDKLQLLINFVTHSAEQEMATRRAWLTSGVAVAAAIIAAIGAVVALWWGLAVGAVT
jgi:hypothetical protein